MVERQRDIECLVYNPNATSMINLHLQFNFIINSIKIYNGAPSAPISCTISGIGSKVIDFKFPTSSTISPFQGKIGLLINGGSDVKPKLEKLVWTDNGDHKFEMPQNQIDGNINKPYFPVD